MKALLSIEKKGQLVLTECEQEKQYDFELKTSLPWVEQILHSFGELGVGKHLEIEGTIERKELARYGTCILGEVKYHLGVCRTCVLSLDHFEEQIQQNFKFIILEDFSDSELYYEGLREVYLFDKKKECSFQDILTEQIILNLNPYPKK